MKRYYVATLHVLVELDDNVPGMSNELSAACDAVSATLEGVGEILDWGYAKTTVPVSDPVIGSSYHAGPVEVMLSEPYREGDLYEMLPKHNGPAPK